MAVCIWFIGMYNEDGKANEVHKNEYDLLSKAEQQVIQGVWLLRTKSIAMNYTCQFISICYPGQLFVIHHNSSFTLK